MTKIIGITGGIGSGKSTMTTHLKKKKFPVHDSDDVVKNVYKKPSINFKTHIKNIGLAETLKKNKINKKTIAEIVFSNPKIKIKLERYIHNVVEKERRQFIEKHKKIKSPIIFIDVPLLFEKNLDYIFDKIVCIICPEKTRFKRVKIKKNISKQIFKKIIKNQTTNTIRRKRADLLILNNKTEKIFIKKINNFLYKLN